MFEIYIMKVLFIINSIKMNIFAFKDNVVALLVFDHAKRFHLSFEQMTRRFSQKTFLFY